MSLFSKALSILFISISHLPHRLGLPTYNNTTLDWATLPTETKNFHVPQLEDIANVLRDKLPNYFATVDVQVVDCPNLKQKPFTLAAEGLNGNPSLVEVGSPAFLLPLVDRSKYYDLKGIAKLTNTNPAFIVGAGAGPFNYAGTNCEGIINFFDENGKINQKTYISKVNVADGTTTQEQLNDNTTQFGLLANFFVSEGKPGKVLKVHVSKRTGTLDYIASIRTILKEHFGDSKVVGLGGTFLLGQGKAKTHVMPDFSKTPLRSDEDLNQWLNFYNMSAPLVAVGTLTTSEFDLDLRVQHFHMFSDHNEAGHYHIDTTPDVVEYLGYFNTANCIYRIDKPKVSQNFGKD